MTYWIFNNVRNILNINNGFEEKVFAENCLIKGSNLNENIFFNFIMKFYNFTKIKDLFCNVDKMAFRLLCYVKKLVRILCHHKEHS